MQPFHADLHVHSSLSPCAEDGMIPPNVIGLLERLDFKIFSITDHNSCGNVEAFCTAAEKKGLVCIPGAELQTSEEVHLLAYFPSVEKIERFFSKVVEPARPPLNNKPEIFGHQSLLDTVGNVIDEEEAMLAMPLDLGIEELVRSIDNHGGIAVPAHIHRRFGILHQLGFIPPTLRFDAVEGADISDQDNAAVGLDPETVVLSSSDAHDLHLFTTPKMSLWLEEPTVEECLKCLRNEDGRYVELLEPE